MLVKKKHSNCELILCIFCSSQVVNSNNLLTDVDCFLEMHSVMLSCLTFCITDILACYFV
jgi:hypothetical protein